MGLWTRVHQPQRYGHLMRPMGSLDVPAGYLPGAEPKSLLILVAVAVTGDEFGIEMELFEEVLYVSFVDVQYPNKYRMIPDPV